jgi:hypothetical protein
LCDETYNAINSNMFSRVASGLLKESSTNSLNDPYNKGRSLTCIMSFLLDVSHMKIKSKNTLVILPFSPRHESPTSMSPGVVVGLGFVLLNPHFVLKGYCFHK